MDTCSVWARVRARFRAFGHGIDPRIKDLDGETAVDSTCHTSEVRAATQDMFWQYLDDTELSNFKNLAEVEGD
jgi:hypothetical protein